MKLESNTYVYIVSYGTGIHYIQGPATKDPKASIEHAKIRVKEAADRRKAAIGRKSPVMSIAIAKIVEVITDGNS